MPEENNMFHKVMPKYSLPRVYNKEGYMKLLNLNSEELTSIQELNLRILGLLRDLGYNFDMQGTFLTADVIMAAYTFLNNGCKVADYDNVMLCLQKLMSNPYSQFYFDLARNEHGMGTTLFHDRINNAYLSRNKSTNYAKWVEYYDTDIEMTLLNIASDMYAKDMNAIRKHSR